MRDQSELIIRVTRRSFFTYEVEVTMPTTVSASPVLVLWRLSTRISMRAQYPLWYYLMLIGLDAILIVGVLGRWQKRAAKLRSKLHGDLRQQMKKQRAGREVKLTRMMELVSEEEGDREGATLVNALRKRREGAVDSAVIRVEGAGAVGPPSTRAATSGEEVKVSTLEHLKQWMD